MPVNGTTLCTKQGSSSPFSKKDLALLNHGVEVTLKTIQFPTKHVYQLYPKVGKSLGWPNWPLLKDPLALRPKIFDKISSQVLLLLLATREV